MEPQSSGRLMRQPPGRIVTATRRPPKSFSGLPTLPRTQCAVTCHAIHREPDAGAAAHPDTGCVSFSGSLASQPLPSDGSPALMSRSLPLPKATDRSCPWCRYRCRLGWSCWCRPSASLPYREPDWSRCPSICCRRLSSSDPDASREQCGCRDQSNSGHRHTSDLLLGMSRGECIVATYGNGTPRRPFHSRHRRTQSSGPAVA